MNRKTPIFLTLGVVLGVALTLAGGAAANPAVLPWHHVEEAAAAPVISYQGQVAVDGKPYSGVGYFKFAIVDLGGTQTYWTNDGQSPGGSITEPTTGISLTVSGGLFTVLLGDLTVPGMTGSLSTATFDDTADRALRVWFSTDNATYQQLAPDRRIAWVPLALQAQYALNAKTVGGLNEAALRNLDLSASNIISGTLSTARFSAHDDLVDENWLGNEANDIAQNNGTLQAGLNADKLDGLDKAAFVAVSGAQTISDTKTFAGTPRFSASGSPFTVDNSGLVSNLNADQVDGLHANALRPVVATATYQVQADLPSSCAPYLVASNTFATISITVPGPGTIIVEASTIVRLATNVMTVMAISETAGADCTPEATYQTVWETPRRYLCAGWCSDQQPYTLLMTLPVRRVFAVSAAGTHSYVLNGLAIDQDNVGTHWISADMQAQYYP